MFLSAEQMKKSLEPLKDVGSFWGIIFLKCKQLRLPVGNTREIDLYSAIREFIEKYYKPYKESAFFYSCFRTSEERDRWQNPSVYLKYLKTNTDTKKLFNNPIENLWGWKDNYIDILKNIYNNHNNQPIPAFHLAVWLYREKEWITKTTPKDIIQIFKQDFLLNEQEISDFFDITIPKNINNLFQEQVVSWGELKTVIGQPPDIPREEGNLTYLEIQGVGAARKLCFKPAYRLSVITGDNGLGKTFLLECAWYALTGHWANLPAYPMQNLSDEEPKIIFKMSGDLESDQKTISYDWQLQRWEKINNRLTISGLVIYARVDGSFAVWDTAKQSSVRLPHPFTFTKDEVWNGRKDKGGNTFINGLLQDWIQWQSKPDKYPFDTLVKVLERLSPPSEGDLGTLKPGESVRLPFDAREIPTIEHPYGTVPIIHASAGVQRIITMAYLTVWAWEEHKIQSALIRKKPQKRMVILVDELEAHLHPQWQRVILPALLDVRDDLASDLQVQIMIATHSPLVMASVESRFDEKIDKLFKLDLVKSDLSGNEVEIQELPFIRQGVIDSWLMSDVFKLRQPRSLDGEKVIEAAKALQMSDNPNPEDVARVSKDLAKYLSEDDQFWPRWVYFAEQQGVDL